MPWHQRPRWQRCSASFLFFVPKHPWPYLPALPTHLGICGNCLLFFDSKVQGSESECQGHEMQMHGNCVSSMLFLYMHTCICSEWLWPLFLKGRLSEYPLSLRCCLSGLPGCCDDALRLVRVFHIEYWRGGGSMFWLYIDFVALPANVDESSLDWKKPLTRTCTHCP